MTDIINWRLLQLKVGLEGYRGEGGREKQRIPRNDFTSGYSYFYTVETYEKHYRERYSK